MNKAIKNTFSIALFGLFFIERLGRWRAFEMNTLLILSNEHHNLGKI